MLVNIEKKNRKEWIHIEKVHITPKGAINGLRGLQDGITYFGECPHLSNSNLTMRDSNTWTNRKPDIDISDKRAENTGKTQEPIIFSITYENSLQRYLLRNENFSYNIYYELQEQFVSFLIIFISLLIIK